MVATEQAMMSRWRGNEHARRYWKAYRQVIMSYGIFQKIGLFLLFQRIVDEIMLSEEDSFINDFADDYSATMVRTLEAIKRFSANHPAFIEAKKTIGPLALFRFGTWA